MRIWIDCDVALGVSWRDPPRDPDDAWALAAVLRAHRAGRAVLLGVSTVFGNTRVERSTAIAKGMLDLAGVSVPVVGGAARAGQRSAAAAAITELPQGTSVLALGPLTNVAAALALDPSLARRIEVRAVGGNLDSWGRFAPYWPFEFNLALDGDAARAVFAAPLARRRMFPLDVCRRLRLGPLDLVQLQLGGDALGRALARGAWSWQAYAPLRYRSLRFPVWDLLPALDALGLLPGVRWEARHLGVAGRGRLVRGGPPSEWVRGFDAAAARAQMLALGLLKGPPAEQDRV